MKKGIIDYIKQLFKLYIFISDDIDTDSAAKRIKSAIWFKGPNVWILAFAIVLASVGLNVNSTAVIIGAMLVSPLMGPIIGTGLALGTNDLELLKAAAKNLLVMVIISLVASTLFFILSPLSLVNPTELEARTSPTIYDVLIALFGGLAGILENSRKERGTVLSGVAIATALMPPLCTAGYGLAHWNMHFFFGALYLFLINSVFIALATYLMVKYLHFATVTDKLPEITRRRKQMVTALFILFLIPSIWSAFVMIRNNNFERNVSSFVENHRLVGPHSYVYSYTVNGRHANLAIAGEPLTDSLRTAFISIAKEYRISEKNLTLTEHSFGMSQQDMHNLIDQIYVRTDNEVGQLISRIDKMQEQLDSLAAQLDENRHLHNGDLIFVGIPSDYHTEDPSMGEAIAAATGNNSGTNWIHTAIVEVRRDSVWIIDATIKRGVDRHPLDTFLVDFTHRDGTLPELMVMRPSGIDVDAAIQRAHSYCGRAYDARFLPDNEDLYCTELVQLCYLDADGQSIFPSEPMNFLAPDGSLPPYWERMFRQLNMRPPQGLPGTNPQRLSESPMLKKVPGIKF